MLLGARTAAWSGGEDAYVNFDGLSQIIFKPDFIDGAVKPFRCVADVTLVYDSTRTNTILIYNSSTGGVDSEYEAFSLACSQSLFTVTNFKLNGNNSASTFDTPDVSLGVDFGERFSFEAGTQYSGEDMMQAYFAVNGSVITSGPSVATSGFAKKYNGYSSSNRPSIGWAYAQSTNWGIGNPSKFNLYRMTFWFDGAVVNDLVPALASDGQGCLYDVKTGAFHTRASNPTGGTLTLVGKSRYAQT